MSDDILPMWTVYHKPADMPEVEYMARKWVVRAKGYEATGLVIIHPLERIREELRVLGYTCIGRQADDDPVIVEVWI